MNIRIFFEYAYLAIGAFSVYNSVKHWESGNSQSFWLNVIFAVMAFLMFWVRRKNRLQEKK